MLQHTADLPLTGHSTYSLMTLYYLHHKFSLRKAIVSERIHCKKARTIMNAAAFPLWMHPSYKWHEALICHHIIFSCRLTSTSNCRVWTGINHKISKYCRSYILISELLLLQNLVRKVKTIILICDIENKRFTNAIFWWPSFVKIQYNFSFKYSNKTATDW